MSGDDDRSSIADKREYHYTITVHAVEQNNLVPDDGYELENDEQRSWKYGVQVKSHALLLVSIDRKLSGKGDLDSPILNGTCSQ